MSANKNIPSRNKLVQRRKKVSQELEQLLRDLGYGTLFPPSPALTEKHHAKWATRKTRIIAQAVELGLSVPQELIDEELGTSDEKHPTPPEDLSKPPF